MDTKSEAIESHIDLNQNIDKKKSYFKRFQRKKEKMKLPNNEDTYQNNNFNVEAAEFIPLSHSNADQSTKNNQVSEFATKLNESKALKAGNRKSRNPTSSSRRRPNNKKSNISNIQQNSANSLGESIAADILEKSCIICASENILYFAIGSCDHPICSVCALRMRYKSKDYSCSVCKSDMNVMIIYSIKDNIRLFNSFGVSDDESPMPGFESDPASKLLFYRCREHYNELQELRSFICPVKKCKLTLSSMNSLTEHIEKNHTDIKICNLCLINRPIFISEIQIYTKKELTNHLTTSNVHKFCTFCNKYFYDFSSFSLHLRDNHLSCHLCTNKYQYRYYKNNENLSNHIISNHIICNICERNNEFVVFNNTNNYSEHMRTVHKVMDINYNSILLGYKQSYSNINYIDLYEIDSETTNLSNQNNIRDNVFTREIVQSNASTLSNVPNNMRVAGRVTGTGRFQRDANDELLQAYMDERASSNTISTVNNAAIKDDFPSLSTITCNKPSINLTKSIDSKHPLSMISTLQSIEANKKKYENDRGKLLAKITESRNKRNEQLALALGLNNIRSLLDYIHPITNTSNELFEKKYLEILENPLFPNVMLQWAKDNSRDLAIIEKKLLDMLVSETEVSLHLKPMSLASRSVMMGLAKFYGLNCYEHDREPKCYVSFVKRLDSCVPTVCLSSAARKGTVNLPLASTMELSSSSLSHTKLSDYNNYENILYFSAVEASLTAFNVNTKASSYSVDRSNGISLNIAEVFRIVTYDITKYGVISLLSSNLSDYGIIDIRVIGGSTAAVVFLSHKHLCSAYYALMNPMSSYLTKGYHNIYSIHCLLPLVQYVTKNKAEESNNWRDKSVDINNDIVLKESNDQILDSCESSEVNDAWDDTPAQQTLNVLSNHQEIRAKYNMESLRNSDDDWEMYDLHMNTTTDNQKSSTKTITKITNYYYDLNDNSNDDEDNENVSDQNYEILNEVTNINLENKNNELSKVEIFCYNCNTLNTITNETSNIDRCRNKQCNVLLLS